MDKVRLWLIKFGQSNKDSGYTDDVRVIAVNIDGALAKAREFRAKDIKKYPKEYEITTVEILAEEG